MATDIKVGDYVRICERIVPGGCSVPEVRILDKMQSCAGLEGTVTEIRSFAPNGFAYRVSLGDGDRGWWWPIELITVDVLGEPASETELVNFLGGA